VGDLVFVSHSSQGDARCRQLRQCLLSELVKRSHEVFLDEDDLSPGDLWRPKIYRALAECNSAVLLLSPDALKSKWVHTESTILAWRRDLRVHFGQQMTLIAVLLEGVTHDRLERPAQDGELAFDHLRLTDAQIKDEPFEEGVDISEVAARIAQCLPDVTFRATDPMTEWAERVSLWLGPVNEGWLNKAAKVFDMPPDDWAVDNQRLTLAAALLFADARCAADEGLVAVVARTTSALKEILNDNTIGDKKKLVDTILPGSMPYSAAAGVLEAMRQTDGQRLALVDVNSSKTAERIVRRATCWDEEVYIEIPPAAQTADEAYDEIKMKIGLSAGVSPPEQVTLEDLEGLNEFQIVILLERGDNGLTGRALGKVLHRLLQEFGPVLFVVAVGQRSADKDELGLGTVRLVQTTIDPATERKINAAITRLEYHHLSLPAEVRT
jgi:hypothetical protein